MNDFKNFLIKYRGAIIGGLIAIILLILRIYKFLVGCTVIIIGIIIGNYVQQNKEKVKDTIRRIVDRW